MGFWRGVLRRFAAPTGTFSAEPRPIDLMFQEMMGSGSAPSVGRLEALSVPAVQRGRNMICSISTLPLVQYGPSREVVPNALLAQLDPDVPNVVTLAQTVEDLLFEGISWWRITEFGFDGYPVKVRHHDHGSVSLTPPVGRSPSPLPAGYDPRGASVWVDGLQVPTSQMIRFDSPNPAVLKVGGRAIKRAILLDKLASTYANDPRPLDYFTPAEGADPAEDDEVQSFLDKWRAYRKQRSTAYVPAALTYNAVQAPSPTELQLVELQRQAGLEIANALGIDPEELGISTTSRTYANAVDRRKDRLNDVLAPFMRAIEHRLSMGDVTRRGYFVAFDLDDYLKADPLTRTAVYKAYLDMGVMTVDQIAAEENLPTPAAPAPAPTVAPETDAEDVGETDTPDEAEANALPAATFSTGAQFVDLPLETFAVDAETRTITGLALPYGKSAKGFRFEKGALQFGDPGRVKLLRDHDPKQAIGHAVELADSGSGFKAKFKVARGAEGDAALALAEDGVLDGLSVGVDFGDTDVMPDPRHKGGFLIRRADLREVSLTAMPAFDDARLTSVKASSTEGVTVPDTIEPTPAPAAPAVVPAAETFTAEPRQEVNPVRLTASVSEPVPYRFDRGGNFTHTQHDFATDLVSMLKRGDLDGGTDAGKRVMGLLAAKFTVETGDINELNPNIQRPDMYVDQADYKYPLWNMVRKGTPPNGVQPFTFPKFNSSSGLVGDHTEGTEPSSGNFTTTSQTVTPTAISGKASITRETWDMGGNPAVSTLIFNQMVRGWNEGLESATATFLNTLTAATDITLTTAAVNEALAADWDAALAGLQFTRGYDFSAFAMEQVLYKAFVAARDDVGRVLYPISAPQNVNGTAQSRFRTLDLGGVTGVPSWALASTPGAANNSWLFDPTVIHGWASAPQRLEFAGTNGSGAYSPVAFIDVAIWGYKAFANTDVAGVRQVIYDSVS
jgi:HK97 family phage prohead protease